MVKGRLFAPSKGRDGQWFRHRGENIFNFERNEATSTGRMMSAPFDSRNKNKPAQPPSPFAYKSEINYMESNRFSEHDNRNTLQDDGTYFGNGNNTRTLGKQIIPGEKRQHFTNSHQLTHGVYPEDHQDPMVNTEYQSSFLGQKTEFPPIHRRFPKVYSAPKEGRIPLDTSTADWMKLGDPIPKTPIRVLAISQQPFLRHNPFKYSYHGNQKIYPSYKRQENLLVDNILNRYGANFPDKR